MRKQLASLVALALMGAAACSKPATPPDDLANDLRTAAGSAVELAPRSAGTQIVSDLEQSPQRMPGSAPRPLATRRRAPSTPPRPAPTAVAEGPKAVLAPAPQPSSVTVAAQSPAPTAEPIIATPRPSPAPQGAPARRGGYSSVSDVLRRAPFPVTP